MHACVFVCTICTRHQSALVQRCQLWRQEVQSRCRQSATLLATPYGALRLVWVKGRLSWLCSCQWPPTNAAVEDAVLSARIEQRLQNMLSIWQLQTAILIIKHLACLLVQSCGPCGRRCHALIIHRRSCRLRTWKRAVMSVRSHGKGGDTEALSVPIVADVVLACPLQVWSWAPWSSSQSNCDQPRQLVRRCCRCRVVVVRGVVLASLLRMWHC
mmetsp:Transcript_4637/g.13991  ORF Transcript_4637/g.13991 Transcript_4637/m.13991 type:complete len:214 (-) Transcript_4637:186-827(-)